MTSLWTVDIRPQSESNIQLEYIIFQCRIVNLKSYVKKGGRLVSVENKVLF